MGSPTFISLPNMVFIFSAASAVKLYNTVCRNDDNRLTDYTSVTPA